MSEEGGFGIGFAEKFFGFLLLAVGIVAFYYAVTSAQALGSFTGFFGFLNIILIALGLVLMTAKTE
jgi:hypothetical protein